MSDLKVVFMGTPEFSVPVLKKLIENYNVVGVVTKPDKEFGRNKVLKFSPIKELALWNNIKVLQPVKIRREYDEIINLNPDIIITCAYGQIIPKALLDYPSLGCVNVHASLLPKLRGGAPIHHAIIDGYEETGITIMYMNEAMDEGNIIAQEVVKISNTDNVGLLHDKLSVIGADLLMKTLPSIINHTNKSIPQNNDDATYAYTIKREDEIIDFNNKTKDIYNKIRGLNPFPGASALLTKKNVKIYETRMGNILKSNSKNGEIINIYDDGIGVKTMDGEIILSMIQFEGKRKMSVKEFLNGNKKPLLGQVFNEVNDEK